MHRFLVTLGVVASLLLGAPAAQAEWEQEWALTAHDGSTNARGPVVAVDSSGAATAVWGETQAPADAASYTMRAATLAPGAASWVFAPNPISGTGVQAGPNSDGFQSTAVGAVPGGGAVAAWVRGTGAAAELEAATQGGAGSSFGTPVVLTSPAEGEAAACPAESSDPFSPVIALGPTGTGHLVWYGHCGIFTPAFARSIQGGTLGLHTFTAEQYVVQDSGGSHQGPSLAATPGGQTAFAYVHGADGGTVGPTSELLFQNAPLGDTKRNHDSNPTAERPSVAVLDGQRLVVWRGSDQRAHLQLGDNAAVTLGASGENALALRAAAGADGTAAVAWLDATSGKWYASVRPPANSGAPGAGTFGAPFVLVDEGGTSLSLAIADNGVGYAVFVRNDGFKENLEGKILDPLDPERSPDKPWEFQPVSDPVFDQLSDGTETGPVSAPSLAVDPVGNAIVTTQAVYKTPQGATRTVAVAIRHLSPRPADPAPPSEDPPAGNPPPGGGDGPPAPEGPPADTKPPKITAASVSRRYFGPGRKEGQRLTTGSERTALGNPRDLFAGTKARFTLTERAKVTLKLVEVGCVSDAPRRTVRCRKHNLDENVWTKRVKKAKRGKNTVRYDGDGVEAGGVYELRLKPVDAAGNVGAVKKVGNIKGDEPR